MKSKLSICLLGMVAVLGFKATLAPAASNGALSDTNINYFGRWDFTSGSQYVSYWGGAYIKVNFSGTTVKIKVGTTSNFYAKIDNGPWVSYLSQGGTINLTPTALASGTHSLSVAQGKDYDYVFNFQGLILDSGATTSPPTVAGNMIEFIGDSITAGYTTAQAEVTDYAWVCSEKLNCEHSQIAYPGINLVSGYAGTGMDVQYFKQQSFNYPSSPSWDFSKYSPKIIVINLGQNDYANNVPDPVFQSSYSNFLANIRAKFPNAEIFAMRTFLGFKSAPTLAAVNSRIATGDTKIHYIDTAGWLTSGSSDYPSNDGVHPSVSGHIKAANLLKAVLTRYFDGDVVGKVTVGYQGWFSAPGDGSPVNAWGHQNLECWPDVREYATNYQTTYPNLSNGQPAKTFSAYDQQVVNTHLTWMAQNNIDCVALQRFVNEISPGSTIKAQRDGMALKVMNAALTTGRKFYIEYDASMRSTLNADIKADWANTIINTLHLTSSPAYAKQFGKPVVGIYGMGYANGPIPGTGSTNDCLDLIKWLKAQGCYVMGGVPGQWRTGTGDSRSDFTSVYQTLDMIGPWAVGRATDSGYLPYLTADFANCVTNGMDYLPNAYPGTSFHNSNLGSPANQFPRNVGNFMWTQFANMRSIGAPSVFIAMFDELNEATQIFKTAEDASMIPTGNWFLTLDAEGTHCSSDFYLRLAKDGGNMIKGLTPLTFTRPTPPVLPVTLPVAPLGLTAVGAAAQVTLNWTASIDATGYNIKRATVSGGPYAILATNIGNISYIDSGLVNGTTYFYQITTVNSLGESSPSSEAPGIPFAAIASASTQNLPNEGAAKAFDGSMSTKWFNANGGSAGWLQCYLGGTARIVVGYTLTSASDMPGRDPRNWQFQGSQNGTTWTTLDTRTAESFASRSQSKQYSFLNSTAFGYYRLNITANNGDASGIQLAEMSFAYGAATPMDVRAAAFSSTQIVLSWTPSHGASSYNIQRASSIGGPYTNIATGILAPFYWDTGLAPFTTCYYLVTAVNAAGESPVSLAAGTTTPALPPPGVNGLTAAPRNGQIILNWTASVGATSYNVKRSTINEGPYTTVSSPAVPSYTDTGLINGTPYYYVVSAVNTGAESTNSTQVTATPSGNISFYDTSLLTFGPVGYWRLNEASGTTATDFSTHGLNATYQSGVTLGASGPNPPYIGFGNSTNAARFQAVTTSYVSLPPLNLNSANVTFTAWIYPTVSAQNKATGLILNRAGLASGLCFTDDGTQISYVWNDDSTTWNFQTGLVPPANKWSFVGLVVSPTNVTFHLYNTNNQSVVIKAHNNASAAFNGETRIGSDSLADGTRNFAGRIAGVAIFNSSLNLTQIGQIYTNGLAGVPVIPDPNLAFTKTGDNVLLNWNAGTLLEANNATGPWTTNFNNSPYTVPATESLKFYRVRLQ